jgi:ubiquitin thioesterase protein OTUB1
MDRSFTITLGSDCYTDRKFPPDSHRYSSSHFFSGHYDILYKLEDLPAPVPTGPPPPVPQNLFVAFSHGQSSQLGNPAPLPFVATNFEIPGMGFFPGQQTSQKSWDPLSAAFGYQSTPVPVQSPPPVNTQPRALPIRTSDFTHVRTANTMPEYYGDSNPPSSHVMTPTSPISPSYGPPLIDSSRFRPSKFEYERDYIAMSSSSSQIYQTPIFKKYGSLDPFDAIDINFC